MFNLPKNWVRVSVNSYARKFFPGRIARLVTPKSRIKKPMTFWITQKTLITHTQLILTWSVSHVNGTKWIYDLLILLLCWIFYIVNILLTNPNYLWSVSQIYPGTTGYNIPSIFPTDGESMILFGYIDPIQCWALSR